MKDPKNIVFIKCHKCSSTTVRMLLEEYAQKKRLKFMYEGYNPKMQLRDAPPVMPEVLKPPYNLSTRHIAYSKKFFDEMMIKPYHFITFIREPLKRAISHYYSLCPLSKSMSFNTFYPKIDEYPEYRMFFTNWMAYFLGYDSPDEIKGINNRYSFIGITEKFNESVKKLEKFLDYQFISQRRNYRYNNNNRYRHFVINNRVRIKFVEDNHPDYMLYNQTISDFP